MHKPIRVEFSNRSMLDQPISVNKLLHFWMARMPDELADFHDKLQN
ncbi:hypothetical protein LMJ53_08530 [Rheinheimera sp. UJ51]|nr:hypothetical protein [Rheinheimera sp. UJ51]MCC5451771.1 hypothetical protein [Rheinheimera sp. UJ51]